MSLKINGSRIREARVFNGLTITQLAEKISVSKQMVSRYEHNTANISLDKFKKLVEVLKFPIGFFTESDKFAYDNSETFYRSRLTSTQSEKQPSEIYKKAAAVTKDFFEQYVNFPKLEPIQLSDNVTPEAAAVALRTKWGLGSLPIQNIVELLERHGLTVINVDLGTDKVDAHSGLVHVNGRSYYVVLSNKNSNFYRSQFTLAHELGHYVLHNGKLDPNDLDSIEYKLMEKEADAFASSFLLPSTPFKNDILSIVIDDVLSYVPLKQKWNVSISSMIYRAYSLGLLSEDQRLKLYKALSYRKWRKNEIFDSESPVSQPRAMKDAFRLIEKHTSIAPVNLATNINNIYGVYYPNVILANVIGIDLNEFSAEVIPLSLKNIE